MSMNIPDELNLNGPFSLPPDNEFENFFSRQPENAGGVYLHTILINEKYRIYYAGMSKNIKDRMRTHIREYLCGVYKIYDPRDARNGRLKVISERCDPEVFIERLVSVSPKLVGFIMATKIFTVELPSDDEYLIKRIESGFIKIAKKTSSPAFALENIRRSVAIDNSELKSVRVRGFEAIDGLDEELAI